MFYNRQGSASSSGFKLLLACLCLLVSGISGIAADARVEKGHTGCVLLKYRSSEFLKVSEVASHSPAADAGVKKGDVVVAIDGVSTSGMSSIESWQRIQGGIGKSVTLTIRQQGEADRQVTIPLQSQPDVYSRAAQEGEPMAQYCLGYYYTGDSPIRDSKKGIEWLNKAADQNYTAAIRDIGTLYDTGYGVPKDFAKAVSYFQRGAKLGDAACEEKLAMMYEYGRGVPPNNKDAFAWYYSAAVQGNLEAESQLGGFYKSGRGAEKNYKEALFWLSDAAKKGDPYAQWNLGDLYRYGHGVKEDAGEALKWYRKAQASLPKNKDLQKDAFEASLAAFSENPETFSIDPTELMTNYRPIVIGVFVILSLLYVAGLIPLLIFTLKKTSAPPAILTASGWMLFYVESQGVAMLAMPLLGMAFSAEGLMGMVGIFSCVPVIISSLGSNRPLLWKTPSGTWLKWLLYVVAGVVSMWVFGDGYSWIYKLITHHPLPAQPTAALVTAAEHHAPWLAYASVVLLIPMTEEIIFRGYFYDALRKHFSPKIVVLLTALAFASIHFQLLYFVPLFAFGMVIGWVKSKTDSIRLTVAIHVVNNLVALLVLK